MSSLDAIVSVGSELIRIAFGSACIVCRCDLPVRRRVASCCVECWAALPRLEQSRCARCALPLPALDPREEGSCLRCATEPLEIDWIDSWGRYDSGLTEVLQAFKFGGHAFLADPLADLLREVLCARGAPAFDVVTAVPMHPAKENRRGYNQAELLGRCLAKRAGVRFDGRIVRKVEERRTQSELKKEARRANVRGTYAASGLAAGLRVLLVDDICTTGETLSACAGALRASGARSVAAVTVARTP
jgi:ComF family protein